MALARRTCAETGGERNRAFPEAAIGAVNLCSQLEYIFRSLNHYVDVGGAWPNPSYRRMASEAFPNRRRSKDTKGAKDPLFGNRVNSVELAYKLLLLSGDPTASLATYQPIGISSGFCMR